MVDDGERVPSSARPPLSAEDSVGDHLFEASADGLSRDSEEIGSLRDLVERVVLDPTLKEDSELEPFCGR
jgi:hypothetical protein